LVKKYNAFNADIPRNETTGADITTIDGKTARHSFTTKDRKSALRTVSAWSYQHQLVLGQTAVFFYD
jgi:photosystem II stability/assembly factor-like uncharacterized protein